ncbi:TPA: MarR family transcriptional regulator [Serratia marcescens]|nr:MarR family transcriptional regulator [Serratia marcescens]
MKKNVKNSNDMFDCEAGILGYLLRKASGAYKQKMEKELNQYQITAPQFVIMSIISNFEGCSNADLARLALLTPQTVSLILVRLEKLELIERLPHPRYKRVQIIKLSTHGETLFASCDKVINKLESTLEDEFSADEIKVIRRWLGKIISE